MTQDLLGYLAEDLDEAREHRAAAFRAATETGHAPLIAQVLVGIADLALRHGQYEQAARLLAASAAVRGLRGSCPSRTSSGSSGKRGIASVTRGSPRRLREGTRANWRELAEVTLAS